MPTKIQHGVLLLALYLHNAQSWTITPKDTARRHPSLLQMTNSLPASSPITTTPPSTLLSPTGHDNKAWKNGYTSCRAETPPTILPCPDLPADFPPGTYYRNGHARFESNDNIRTYHMFDGDGMITGHTFDPVTRTILFRNRFVRTDGYRDDVATGTNTRPSVFGTKVSGGFWKNLFRTDFKNVGNTGVLYRAAGDGGTLYALWEGGLPWMVDALTLETITPRGTDGDTLNGLLSRSDAFAAHYRIDPDTGHVCNFGTALDPVKGETSVSIYELGEDMTPARDVCRFTFEGAAAIHDFCITTNWYLFCLPPAGVNNRRAIGALLGREAFASVIDFDMDATHATVFLIPRKGGGGNMIAGTDERVKMIKVPNHFSFHFANAFEDENGHVYFDSVCTDDANLGLNYPKDVPIWESVVWEDVPTRIYARYAVDPQFESSVVGLPPRRIVSERNPEFPTVPKELVGKKHCYAYAVGTHNNNTDHCGTPGSILKLNCDNPAKNEAYSFEPYEFPGEPMFVSKVGAAVVAGTKEGEDAGYLLAHVHNGKDMTTDLVIFDVEGDGALEKGPVVRVRLPTFIPHALHGTFVEGLTFGV